MVRIIIILLLSSLDLLRCKDRGGGGGEEEGDDLDELVDDGSDEGIDGGSKIRMEPGQGCRWAELSGSCCWSSATRMMMTGSMPLEPQGCRKVLSPVVPSLSLSGDQRQQLLLFIVALVIVEAVYPSCASYSLCGLVGPVVLRLPYSG